MAEKKAMIVKHDAENQGGVDRPTGVVHAMLVDIYDVGLSEDKFNPGKKVHRVALTWMLADTYKNKEGADVHFLQTEIIRFSLNEKATLRKYLAGMAGKAAEKIFTVEKMKEGIDIMNFIGVNCMLTLEKKENSDFTHTVSCAPLMNGLTKMPKTDVPTPKWVTELTDEVGTEDAAAEDSPDLTDVINTL